jgi:hypothetical protein
MRAEEVLALSGLEDSKTRIQEPLSMSARSWKPKAGGNTHSRSKTKSMQMSAERQDSNFAPSKRSKVLSQDSARVESRKSSKVQGQLQQMKTKPANDHRILEDRQQLMTAEELKQEYDAIAQLNQLDVNYNQTIRDERRHYLSSGNEEERFTQKTVDQYPGNKQNGAASAHQPDDKSVVRQAPLAVESAKFKSITDDTVHSRAQRESIENE